MSEENIGEIKFNSCIHRSSEKEDVSIRSCCVSTKKEVYSFICYERNIDRLTPRNCASCNLYLQRINPITKISNESNIDPFS